MVGRSVGWLVGSSVGWTSWFLCFASLLDVWPSPTELRENVVRCIGCARTHDALRIDGSDGFVL